MKTSLLSFLAKTSTALALVASLLVGFAPAVAQVPSTAPPAFSTRSYSAAITFTPATTATSDFFTLTGAANVLTRVTRAECSGTSTAAGLVPISVIVRSAIPSVAGTSTSPTAVRNDQTDTAASSVVRAYTVAPTAGAAIGTIRIGNLLTSVTGTPSTTPALVYDFSTRPYERGGIYLRTAAQVFALNTTAVAGLAISCNVEWTEQ